jgi:hypothetical protein
MGLEENQVIAWLLELGQVEAAALLSEAEFDYTYVDTAFRLDAEYDETDILELSIRVPPRIYRGLQERYATEVSQVEAAISELTAHTKGSWIRSTNWMLKMPVLEEVEGSPDVSELFSDSGLHDVQRLWTKCKARATADPDGAITAARTMLESLCKLVIDEAGGAYSNRDDLPSLYRKAADSLDLAPSQQTDSEYRKLVGACMSIVQSTSTIRNREGDSHATGLVASQVHARFVVNLSGSVASFLIGLRSQREGPRADPTQPDDQN